MIREDEIMKNREYDFSIFKKFVFDDPNKDIWHNKHAFFKVEPKEIAETEDRIGILLPNELKAFYNDVGYGFICVGKSVYVNRIISPSEIADFYLGVDDYKNDERRKYYQDKTKLIFCEVSENTFLIMDLSQENSLGQCPIYDYDEKIADSLIDFLERMDKEVNYYMK
jgi:hypothetical protein